MFRRPKHRHVFFIILCQDHRVVGNFNNCQSVVSLFIAYTPRRKVALLKVGLKIRLLFQLFFANITATVCYF